MRHRRALCSTASFLGLLLALCCSPLFGQEPLRRLAAPELDLIRGSLSARKEIARVTVERLQRKERLHPVHSFKERSAHLDHFGQVHVRYDQFYRGVRVWDGAAIIHLGPDGTALEPTKAYRRDLSQPVAPQVRLEQAQATAAADPTIRDFVPNPVQSELVLYPVMGERISPVRSKPGEKPNAEDVDRYADYHLLAWHIRLQGLSPDEGLISRDYIVNATNGTIFKSWNSLQTAEAVGTGRSQYSGTVKASGPYLQIPFLLHRKSVILGNWRYGPSRFRNLISSAWGARLSP